MPPAQQIKNQHLLWRAGFGINAETVKDIATVPHQVLYGLLETAALPKPKYIDVADDTVKGLMMGIQQVADMQQADKPPKDAQRKQFRKESEQNIRDLSISWMNEMVYRDAQLRQKMSRFG